MKKLWQKGNKKIDPLFEAFATKEDLVLDQKLIPYDIEGSIAHAKMLKKVGILTESELNTLKKGVNEILKLWKQGKFNLELGDEDMHTKIEDYLTKNYGEAGKKIHTARSRNDQVLTALRLYSKEQLNLVKQELENLKTSFKSFGKKHKDIPMPGYTHMQKAMPSSIKLWADCFVDSLSDDLIYLDTIYKLIDQSPLGSGAGYGIPIKIDRQLSAKLLNFAKVQENPIYCQHSRLKFEELILSCLITILQDINKFASDVLLFTTSEFNFFSVAGNLTTGSSIMPQKKNIDVAEVLRAKVHLVLGNYVQIVSLSTNLISGYNRDFQDSKKPFMESLDLTLGSLKVASLLVKGLTPNKEILDKAMTEELYATEKALKLVSKGMPFREAYKKVASVILSGAKNLYLDPSGPLDHQDDNSKPSFAPPWPELRRPSKASEGKKGGENSEK